QPPSPATPIGRGAEPDSGVGRTDESTRNEESSEHDLLGEEGGEGPPAPPRPPPPRREPQNLQNPPQNLQNPPQNLQNPPQNPPQNPQNSPQSAARLHAKPGAGLAAARSGSGSGCGSAGRAGSGAGGRRGMAGLETGLEPGLGARLEPGLGARLEPGLGPGLGPGPPSLAALSPAELRRYRALRGRCAGPAGRAELARLEEELRHLEFKCRHLLRAQQLERLRERGRRAWRDPEGPLADIAEAPERDSTSAYNTGESSRSSPLLLRAGLGAPPPAAPPSGAAPSSAKGPRGKRPGRDRLLKARAIKILEERGGSTDDDARSELKTGRYWSREQRKQHLARAREQRRRRELLLQARPELPPGSGAAGGGGAEAAAAAAPPPQHGQGSRRGLRKRSRRILDNWVSIQEMMLAQHGGRLEHPLLSVTTV
ncbi:PDZD4 protein, partial [Spizella passerina]|nr:PDZD4 protein [Spizella passerina]